MNENRYILAGWLAIFSALILVPEIVLAILLDRVSSTYPIAKALVACLRITNAAIAIYVLWMFRDLLNARYNFHKVDTLITIFIWTNILFVVIGLLGLIPGLAITMSVLTLVLFVPFSGLQILFATKLLRLEDELFGLLKPFAYTIVAAGICGASIVLMPLGALAAVASLFMQGMIFLRAKEEVQFV